MKRKTISCLFLLSLLTYAGCYNISNPVQISQRELERDQTDITVVTMENKRFEFAEGKYQILNDTLSGTGALEPMNPSKDIRIMKVTIPLSDIVSIQKRKIDPVNTILLIGTMGAIIYLVATWKGFPF